MKYIINLIVLASILTLSSCEVGLNIPSFNLPTFTGSAIKNGGIVIKEENGHGLVLSQSDNPEMNWNAAMMTSDTINIEGFNDWRLPTNDELKLICGLDTMQYLYYASMSDKSYWSSTEYTVNRVWGFDFGVNKTQNFEKTDKLVFRVVREF